MSFRQSVLRACYKVYFKAPLWVRRAVRAAAGPAARMLAAQRSVSVEGMTMHLDAEDGGALVYVARADVYEPVERALFREAIKANPGCTVIDLGAQYGIYTLTALATGSPGHCIAVEASPCCSRPLAKTLQAIPPQLCTLFAGAVGGAPGAATLWLDPKSSSDNRAFQAGTHTPGATSVEVPVETVDRLVERAGLDPKGAFVVKMDVQGAECRALAGMERLIDSARTLWIFFECGGSYLEASGSTTGELADRLARAQLTRAWRVEKEDRGLAALSIDELLSEIRSSLPLACEDYVVARDPGRGVG